ncbi:MAG: hypothetical protein CL908_13175 [Deltaproteobacteria bacterium]|nr:hypothetical protein [Deltaproteobacteria bacterium]
MRPVPRRSSSFLSACFTTALLCSIGTSISGCFDEGAPGTAAPESVRPSGDLVAVALAGEGRAIVVAARGEIYFSDDAGDSWQRAHVPATAALRDLAMADRRQGWAVGEGVILRTDDGGATWRRQRLPGEAARIRLSAVAAIDGDRAISVGEEGVRLRTADGGAVWTDVSRRPQQPGEVLAAIADAVCPPGESGDCWSVGSAIRQTRDGGQSWRLEELASPVDLEAFPFGFGEVEIAAEWAERWASVASAERHRTDLHWQIEADLSELEVERFSGQDDPLALFELLEARLEEIRSVLEEAGVDPDRIELEAAPAWDFEEYLDDDPGFLDRYWQARTRSVARGRVELVEELSLAGVAVDRRGLAAAVGGGGRIYLRPARESLGASLEIPVPSAWKLETRIAPHALLAVAFGRQRMVAVGVQGAIWLSSDRGRSWASLVSPSVSPFFDALRDVEFSASGEVGLVVGEQGRILRSQDGGVSWRPLAP